MRYPSDVTLGVSSIGPRIWSSSPARTNAYLAPARSVPIPVMKTPVPTRADRRWSSSVSRSSVVGGSYERFATAGRDDETVDGVVDEDATTSRGPVADGVPPAVGDPMIDGHSEAEGASALATGQVVTTAGPPEVARAFDREPGRTPAPQAAQRADHPRTGRRHDGQRASGAVHSRRSAIGPMTAPSVAQTNRGRPRLRATYSAASVKPTTQIGMAMTKRISMALYPNRAAGR
jgi:hypothetical protein